MSNNRTLLSGHKVEKLSEESLDRIHKFFTRYEQFVPLMKLTPGNWILPECCADILDKIHNFNFQPNDVLVSAFPKSGTTWMLEIVWSLLHNPNLDNPLAKLSTDYRTPHIEADLFIKTDPELKLGPNHPLRQACEKASPGRGADEFPLFTNTELSKSPRVIKTHLSFSLFPKSMIETNKVIYVARDPRDLITSRFYWLRLMRVYDFNGNLDDYLNFVNLGEIYFEPYFTNVKEALSLKNHPNVLIIYYENLKRDQEGQITKINEFLGAGCTKEQIKAITHYTSFTQMKERSDRKDVATPMADHGRLINVSELEKCGTLFRKGEIGDWKNTFNVKQVEKIEKWIREGTKDFPEEYPYFAD